MIEAKAFELNNGRSATNQDQKEETKLPHYADDATAILGDTNLEKTSFELLDLLHVNSGLKQNNRAHV